MKFETDSVPGSIPGTSTNALRTPMHKVGTRNPRSIFKRLKSLSCMGAVVQNAWIAELARTTP